MKRFLAVLAAGAALTWAASAAAADVYDFSYTGQEVTWVVPESGIYQMDAAGAQGGNSGSEFPVGGLGAQVGGDIALTVGEVLEIIVGQQGLQPTGDTAGGGGGGTFAFLPGAATPLIVAGGGGGAGWSNGTAGGAGQATQGGRDGTGTAVGAGGSDGEGGSAALDTNGDGGGGGAGWLSAGGSGQPHTDPSGGGGLSAPSFAGGSIIPGNSVNQYHFVSGGFGGGGAGGYNGGGGGGGYSGGGGGNVGGGGGGSYLDAGSYDTFGSSGVQTGNGFLDISEVSPAPEPETWALMITGLGLLGLKMRGKLRSALSQR